jgi:hypothetical protein
MKTMLLDSRKCPQCRVGPLGPSPISLETNGVIMMLHDSARHSMGLELDLNLSEHPLAEPEFYRSMPKFARKS